MSKKNYTHISIILDRSGSMSSIASDVAGGLKTLIEDQKKVEGEATLSLIQFDDQYEVIHNFKPVSEIDYVGFMPRGSTALLDAMGKAISETKEHIEKMKEEERPEKVLITVITDGQENASREYSKDIIFKMIERLKEDKDMGVIFEFAFIGANQDAIKEGGSYGIRSNLNYTADSNGTQYMLKSLSNSTSAYRCCSADGFSFSDNSNSEVKS